MDTIYDRYEYEGKTPTRCKKWVGPNGYIIKNRFADRPNIWFAHNLDGEVISSDEQRPHIPLGFSSFEAAVIAIERAVEPEPEEFEFTAEELAELDTINLEETTDA